MSCTLNLENIDDELYKINQIKSPRTPDEKFNEMRRELVYVKNELKEINKVLCILINRVSTLSTRINLIDDTF